MVSLMESAPGLMPSIDPYVSTWGRSNARVVFIIRMNRIGGLLQAEHLSGKRARASIRQRAQLELFHSGSCGALRLFIVWMDLTMNR